MINIFDFTSNIDTDDFYALVTYDNKVEPTYFRLYGNLASGFLWLHSPCCRPTVIHKFTKQEQENIKKYCIETLLPHLYEFEDITSIEEFYDEFIKHMIVNNVLYDIPVFQCSPYLPKEVDNIEIISEGEMLLWLLKNQEK